MPEIRAKHALTKAFLKVKPGRSEVENFKKHFIDLLNNVNDLESEEHHKNLISEFLRKVGFDQRHFINTKAKSDLVIHLSKNATSSAGVILETKKPTNKNEMPNGQSLNCKALQELLLYYLRERISLRNLDIKNLAITNATEWYLFDAHVFESAFAHDKELVRKFIAFEEGRLSGWTTDFFYKEVAAPAIASAQSDLTYTYVDLLDYESYARDENSSNDRKLIELIKLFSPEHLLKLPFQNDSNSLDQRFYTELLHIVGLEEVRDRSKRVIQRKPAATRNPASLLENAISQVDALDKLQRLRDPKQFGDDKEEQLFAVALELCITWVNRILFLKLLEAQLISFNVSQEHAFLNGSRIRSYDDLNSLFFGVLARDWASRDPDARERFGRVPYLNSSLFEPTSLEHETLMIGNLSEGRMLPLPSNTVLKDATGHRLTGTVDALQYFLKFLDSFDFASTGAEEIQEDEKSLISASVLGLIFEKINNYKEGAFFTPGFVTMYMSREAVRAAVIRRFNLAKGWACTTFEELYDKIEDRAEANRIFEELRICDPAVGSGHFLVSVLNELIAAKSELKILCDRTGARLKEYSVQVENDELIVLDEEGELFEYKRMSPESQRVQEALFHEKERLIENCLFGVDINPNSAKICRLRLWIELLKSAYYKADGELETLPNIDINIKTGNSLLARYPLDANLKNALKKNKRSLSEYRTAVSKYRTTKTKTEKFEMEKLISDIKSTYQQEINSNDPRVLRLQNAKEELETLARQRGLFNESPEAKKKREKTVARLVSEVARLEDEVEQIKSSRMFRGAFEWRFEFPEVLDSHGTFTGFDLVIGNPPYGVPIRGEERTHLVERLGKVPDFEIYYWFINRSRNLLASGGILSFIIPNTILFNLGAAAYRLGLFESWSLDEMLDCSAFPIFPEATVRNVIVRARRVAGEKLCYRPTLTGSSFQRLVVSPIQCVPLEKVAENNLNWGLMFRLSAEMLALVARIRGTSTHLKNFFPDLSQGLIAYDKYQGQDAQTIKSRAFHTTSPVGAGWKKWLWGSDVTRFNVSWNGTEYVRYGAGIANPRDPKYFVGRRLLVREITNPRVYAALTSDELYNDPAVIIVKDNPAAPITLECVEAILNSKLATFYHFNSSPKATKGAFPKILVHDVEHFPLPRDLAPGAALQIEAVGRSLRENRTHELEAQLDSLVYAAFGMDENDIELVETWFQAIESTASNDEGSDSADLSIHRVTAA
jgi:adenine-specific DNA-methyltransferase